MTPSVQGPLHGSVAPRSSQDGAANDRRDERIILLGAAFVGTMDWLDLALHSGAKDEYLMRLPKWQK